MPWGGLTGMLSLALNAQLQKEPQRLLPTSLPMRN
jgi:hypothetical protein